ncbi:MAG: hypothetical protein L0211_11685 [Planctomycetaceae bacterium]|nr:hypothetical protein [Planctomycetaceae bacterium]
MSNETRTMLVVLLVCGFLLCGCIAMPIGVGAMFYLTAARQAEVAQVQAQRAIAEQQARAQADAARMAELTPPEAAGIPAIPALPAGGPVLPADAFTTLLSDVEQRKSLYRAFKDLRKAEEELNKAATGDPTIDALTTALKQQQEVLLKNAGITREQIDKILEEGDKAGW